MSAFGDYKSYKLYEPSYSAWKNKQDLMEAKRLAYINKHPEIVNPEDVQRGKILLRAIDIMDEHSQKKAENMEAATEPIIEMGLEFAGFAGMGLGALLGSIKPIGRFFARFVPKGSKYKKYIGIGRGNDIQSGSGAYGVSCPCNHGDGRIRLSLGYHHRCLR